MLDCLLQMKQCSYQLVCYVYALVTASARQMCYLTSLHLPRILQQNYCHPMQTWNCLLHWLPLVWQRGWQKWREGRFLLHSSYFKAYLWHFHEWLFLQASFFLSIDQSIAFLYLRVMSLKWQFTIWSFHVPVREPIDPYALISVPASELLSFFARYLMPM